MNAQDFSEADQRLHDGLAAAMAPLLHAIERPELRLHSVVVESGTVSALIELADNPDVTYQLVIPLSAPTAAMLSCVSGHRA